jgi:hypothetical protein
MGWQVERYCDVFLEGLSVAMKELNGLNPMFVVDIVTLQIHIDSMKASANSRTTKCRTT